MNENSFVPGGMWCAVAGVCDIAVLAYIDFEYWGRMAGMGPLLSILIIFGVALSFFWSLTLSNKLRTAIQDSHSEAKGPQDHLVEPLHQVWILVFHGEFFALCTVGVALACIAHLLALKH
jgi:hypothetical protein